MREEVQDMLILSELAQETMTDKFKSELNKNLLASEALRDETKFGNIKKGLEDSLKRQGRRIYGFDTKKDMAAFLDEARKGIIKKLREKKLGEDDISKLVSDSPIKESSVKSLEEVYAKHLGLAKGRTLFDSLFHWQHPGGEKYRSLPTLGVSAMAADLFKRFDTYEAVPDDKPSERALINRKLKNIGVRGMQTVEDDSVILNRYFENIKSSGIKPRTAEKYYKKFVSEVYPLDEEILARFAIPAPPKMTVEFPVPSRSSSRRSGVASTSKSVSSQGLQVDDVDSDIEEESELLKPYVEEPETKKPVTKTVHVDRKKKGKGKLGK